MTLEARFTFALWVGRSSVALRFTLALPASAGVAARTMKLADPGGTMLLAYFLNLHKPSFQ